jgi:hypothetical protein
MSAIQYLALGIVATLLAALRLFAWTAVGLALGAERLRSGVAVRTAVAVLAGACLTMLAYAVLAAAGMLVTALALDALVAAAAIGWRCRDAARSLRETAQLLIPQSVAGRAAVCAVLLLLWVVAIGPPRDGDVMHYHLAHIRQIIAAGVWRQLPICSYGIPFGWSLTYLPFEWRGVPQGAQLLNTGAWLLTCALCIETADSLQAGGGAGSRNVARWMLLAITLLPIVLKSATTAMADAFLILAVALSLALLAHWRSADRAAATALGFAAFVGLTTRYQAAAAAIAVTLIVGVDLARRRDARRLLAPFVAGAVAALAAALPFYVANQLTLGSAVWPFAKPLIGRFAAQGSDGGEAAAKLAALCTSIATGRGSSILLRSAAHLLVDRTAFPIPLLVVVGAATVLAIRGPGSRRVAIFALLFLAIWALVQPALSPRFSVYLTAAAIMCCAPLVARLLVTRARRAVRIAGAVAVGSLTIVAVAYARDYVRLSVTGDVARFHHATWYWPAYDWANRNTPASARFVVALYGGHTYALDRWNVSADPGSSAIVPWDAMATECDLADILARERADYLFYGPNVWSGRPMNEHIERTIGSAAKGGVLDSVRVFDVPIVYGRMEGLERRTRIILYRVDRSAARRECASR